MELRSGRKTDEINGINEMADSDGERENVDENGEQVLIQSIMEEREENEEMQLYQKYTVIGEKLGLRGDALASFVASVVHNEKEEARKQKEGERKQEIEMEKLRILQREAYEKREAEKNDEERKQREEERRDAELAIKRQEVKTKSQAREEEIRIRREENSMHVAHLDPLRDGDDVDVYLTHFERMATLCKWGKPLWSTKLVSLLRGNARQAVLRMHPEELKEYDKVKKALLSHFRLDAEAYRHRFREMKKEMDESFDQLLIRMKSCFSLWCQAANKDENDAEDVKDLLFQEQMYRILSQELVVEVKKMCPGTAEDIAIQADIVVEAKRLSRDIKSFESKTKRHEQRYHDKDPLVSENEQTRQDRRSTVKVQDQLRQHGQSTTQMHGGDGKDKSSLRSTVKCFKCLETGHIARFCKKGVATVKAEQEVESECITTPSLCVSCAAKPYSPRCEVRVNGLPGEGIRDTGAGYTVVSETLVQSEDYTGDHVCVVLAESRCRSRLPVAEVELESPFVCGKVCVLVMKQPVEDVLIGNYIQRGKGEPFEKVPVYGIPKMVAAVQTRAQTHKMQQPRTPLELREQILLASRETLMKKQEEDETLKKAREACQSAKIIVMKKGQVQYKKKEGILIRCFTNETEKEEQICVPKDIRPSVLALAHDVPMSGHLGVAKTKGRILAHFYWPSVCADISRFCQSCEKCQKTIDKGRVPPVPLGKMPIIQNPFERVGMDLIGPLTPMSQSGHRYALVMVDYATRYPEAIPLRDVTAKSVAEAAFEMWTRTGIPREVLTDNGSQFTSETMKEVFRLLAIKGLRTTPYHAQCNGLVERFNGTLKRMLRRLVQEQPQEWDRWIPALLFAYREVPQASTGFAPFELLYGRRVRGPMQILKELWTHPENEELKTAVEYVVDLRNKIAESCAIAQENLEAASRKYKRHFDLKTKKRKFQVGSKVLVLRPVKNNKLELAWKGPFAVIGKQGEADYQIRMGPKNKLFHANMLKQFVEREPSLVPETTVASVVIEEEEDEDDTARVIGKDIPVIPLQATESAKDVQIRAENETLKHDLQRLVKEYSDVLTDVPSCTNMTECKIKLTTDEPVRAKPYPVPFSQRDTVKAEVKSMLDMGVIEPSVSPYAAPIVLVKKKDGKIRFCVDYRRLNKIVEFDAEPIPDIEYLFAKLGEKRVFSKLDLSKGYWQIPVAEEDRPKTAFCTPQGQFQWKVMPFGLCTSGAVFTRMMRNLLQPLDNDDVDNFIDDIMIATRTEEEHVPAVRSVLKRLREASLTARPTKCELGCKEVSYLGYRIGQGQCKPEEDKMVRIRRAPRPQTKKQVRSFLGVLSFYKRFIPNYSDVALPLTDLTKGIRQGQIKWSDECEVAFEKLKEVFVRPPVCELPVAGKPYVLRTDASGTGIGAALFQDCEGELKLVSCASKKMSKAERNYPVIEQECLALVWAVRKFSTFLYGVKFTVQTDHSPLQYLHKVKTASGRVTRWALLLQPYQFTVEAIPGKENITADYLSRIGDVEEE